MNYYTIYTSNTTPRSYIGVPCNSKIAFGSDSIAAEPSVSAWCNGCSSTHQFNLDRLIYCGTPVLMRKFKKYALQNGIEIRHD